MRGIVPPGITERLSDSFKDAWRLLSETTHFLARTPEFPLHEENLRRLRAELQFRAADPARAKAVRDEVAALRAGLRAQGYDLSIAAQSLRFEGFRNDACIREGFRRLVLFFTDREVRYLSGDDNHVALADFLEARVEAAGERITERHYLWFARRGNELVLSGSDTEMKDDFRRLEEIGSARELFLLAKLKRLR